MFLSSLRNIEYKPWDRDAWKAQKGWVISNITDDNYFLPLNVSEILIDGLHELDKILEEIEMIHVQVQKRQKVKLMKVMEKKIRDKIKKTMKQWHFAFIPEILQYLIEVAVGFICCE